MSPVSKTRNDSAFVIPGDSIEQSPEWITATRRAFPLLPDEEIREAFASLQGANEFYQGLLDAQVDAESST